MRLNLIGPFTVNAPFGTEIAFAKGLRRQGHEVVEVDPNLAIECGMSLLDPQADATVVFKSCVGRESHLEGLRHPVITYQPDDARFPHIREMMLMMRKHSDLFLSFDSHGADVARTMGYRAAETLLLTADDELYCPSPEPIERDIDVSFIGSLGDPVAHASRRRMCEIIQAEADRNGWKTMFGTTQHMPTILDVYRRSKVVLNHATDVGQPFGMGYGYQCRHFEVGMTNTCLISNCRPISLMGVGIGTPYDFWNEETLVRNVTKALTESYDCNGQMVPLYELLAFALNQDIRQKHMPEHRADQLVDFITRNA